MHFGNKNPGRDFFIENGIERVVLGVTEVENDLGIIIYRNGENNQQATRAISHVNYALGRMRKTFKFFNINLFKMLYPTIIRPYLVFAAPVWNFLSKDSIRKLEGIQRRATIMVIEG